MPEKPIVIGVGGFARSGKDTFVKIAKKILKENGYSSIKLAFADQLKEEIDPFLREYYGISAWTDATEEKNLIRPLLVAHGCQKRIQTNGSYWIDKINEEINLIHCEDVVFVSDCRFPNEVDWVHNKWGGWFVHVKKYSMRHEYVGLFDNGDVIKSGPLQKVYDSAPNEEEAMNDPMCEQKADYKLEMENAIEREQRLNGIKITVDSLKDNTYLNEEIKSCLLKCPFLTLR
jgi:hypothetical protein